MRTFVPPSKRRLFSRGRADVVEDVAFSPDGHWLATGSDDQTARIWDTRTGSQRHVLVHDGYVGAVAFSPDGRWLATGCGDSTARIWDTHTGLQRQVLLHEHPYSVAGVAFSPDGRWLATTHSHDQGARIWDTHTGQQLRSLLLHLNDLNGVAFSPDGHWLAIAAGATAVISDSHSGQQLYVLPFNDHVYAMALSRDGRQIATAHQDNRAMLWALMPPTHH